MTDHTQAREALERSRIRCEGLQPFDTRLVTALVASLDAEIAELKARMTWQPIETATDEGTAILVYDQRSKPERRQEIRRSDGGFWRWCKSQGHPTPNGWMPLPKPPEEV